MVAKISKKNGIPDPAHPYLGIIFFQRDILNVSLNDMRQRMHSHIGCIALVAIVFGLENPPFLAKSDISIPKCTEGVGGPPV